MSTHDLVTVASFTTPLEAEIARLRLESAGIRAIVSDVATSGWFWYFGTAMGGAKLQVSLDDVAQASAVISSLDHASSDSAFPESDWTCSSCGAPVDAGFEVCWSCGAEFGGGGRAFGQTEAPTAEEDADDGVDKADDSVDSFDSSSGKSPTCDMLARRAWLSSVLGTVFCPPLITLYSLALMARTVWAGSPLTSYARRRLLGAGIVNAVMFLMVGVFLWMILGSDGFLFSTPWSSTSTELVHSDELFHDVSHDTFVPGQQWSCTLPGASRASTVTVLAVQEVPSVDDAREIAVLVRVETPRQSPTGSPRSEVIPLLAMSPKALSKSADVLIAQNVDLPAFREEYARWIGGPLGPSEPNLPTRSNHGGGELPFSLRMRRTNPKVLVLKQANARRLSVVR